MLLLLYSPCVRACVCDVLAELGACIDESEDCREMAANGRCYGDSAVNHKANFCLKSCGMCGKHYSVVGALSCTPHHVSGTLNLYIA